MSPIVRPAVRRLLRAPAFTAAAVFTLALGIGGASAVFTVINGVLLQPLPYDHADRLVDLSHTLAVSGVLNVDQSDATYLVYRAENHAFTDVGIYRSTAVNNGGLVGSAGAAAPERVPAALMSAGTFAVLGAAPARGRLLTDDDGKPGAPPVVVIGQELWRRTFAESPTAVGARIVVDGVARTIVGVAQSQFRFPTDDTELWLPLTIDPARTKSAAFDYRGIARLKDGMSIAGAEGDLQRLLPRVPQEYPGRLTSGAITATRMQTVVRPLRDVVVGDVGPALWIVFGAVGVLLLIACANVANLFLARAEGRHAELAIRRALGAGNAQVLAEFVSEAVIVSGVGGALGLLSAVIGVHALQTTGASTAIPRLAEVHPDGAVLTVSMGAVMIAALLVSALPLLRTRAVSLSATLLASGRTVGGRARHRARRALVVTQVALALVLLAAAGLLARSFERLRSVNPGFTSTHTVAARLALPTAAYPTTPAAARAIMRILDAVRELPGVRAVGVTTKLPLEDPGRQDSAVLVEDRPRQPGALPNLHQIVFASPGYFEAMGIPLVAGRAFGAPNADGTPAAGPPEVVVSQAFAVRYWQNDSPIGKHIRMNPNDPWHVVVGVVGSVRDAGLDQPLTDAVYCPLVTMSALGAPWVPRDLALVVRTAGDPADVVSPIRRAVSGVDPDLPLYGVITTSSLVSDASARTTFTLLMLGVAALVALAIGAVGIYGVIAYLV
ncbi:MAG TPA: ADOP family duplicated permease, partial [Gemmatimonadaceae bacterium]|nr:ADOP family duplicated permease [Gemmatimonadaceae bacterium]